jgi:hypothetical protein
MGGTTKWPYNDSQCLDADYFKIIADSLLCESGVRPLLHTFVGKKGRGVEMRGEREGLEG